MRWVMVSLVVGAGASLGGLAVAAAGGRAHSGARSSPQSAQFVSAHPLGGDELIAGPVLLDQRAAWVEVGAHRLLVRSLDAFGRTRTIFSTTKAPGAPEGTPWPFWVDSLAAGDGRVAFVMQVVPCESAPPRSRACGGGVAPAPADSATLFAGRPGAIRAVETVGRPCGKALEPSEAAVSRDGLVVGENHDEACSGRARGRVVLRDFRGRMLRVLGRSRALSVMAAGPWAGFVEWVSNHAELRIVRSRTGETVVRRHSASPVAALDASGLFAFFSVGGPGPCGRGVRDPLVSLTVGRVGQRGVTVVTRAAAGGFATGGGKVVFIRGVGRCLDTRQIDVDTPGSPPRQVVGFGAGRSLAFDGRLLSASGYKTIKLTVTDCQHPTVPVPPNEPVYRPGPTEVVSGVYIQGGPAPVPPCRPEPRGPYAATIRLINPHTGATVASQRVRDGHLAHIAVAPGTYKLSTSRSASFSPTVRVRKGYKVRQDLFEDVP